MADLILNGVGVALVTPFNNDFSVDFESLEKLIEHVIEGGCNYLVALGTTGEPPTLSEEEKILVTRFIREKVNHRVPLLLGIGGNSTTKVMENILNRDLEGYDAILSVTPYYNKPNQEGLFLHYKAISEVSPLPILLYNVPGRTGVNLLPETTLRLANLSEKIIGIKEASGKLNQSEEIINNAHGNFKVISGDDSMIAPLMQKGAIGVISVLANAFPNLVKRITELSLQQKFEEAQSLQKSLQPLIAHIFEDGNPAGIKAILHKMGITKNILRLPLVPVGKETQDKIYQDLELLQNLS